MKRILDFLSDLRENNNREWFAANKGRYKEAEAIFNVFAEELIAALGEFDASVRGLTLRECTYRIYRDTRFSHDKTPYKTHFGLYVCPGGKKSGNAGYYFHIEPAQADKDSTTGMLGGHILSAGVYLPTPAALKSIREDILYNSDGFLGALHRAEGFTLESYGRLKRVPSGYPVDSPMAEYLKMKDDVSVYKHMDDKFMTTPGLLERTAAEYRKTSDFVRWLNRAIAYSKN